MNTNDIFTKVDTDFIYDLLRSDSSIVINKHLIHSIGLTETIIFSELLSKYNYFKNKETLTEDGFFFCTVADLEESTGIQRRSQETAIKSLIKYDLIMYTLRGIPQLRYFKINPNMGNLMYLVNKQRDHKANKITN
jgi:hypothetical protein